MHALYLYGLKRDVGSCRSVAQTGTLPWPLAYGVQVINKEQGKDAFAHDSIDIETDVPFSQPADTHPSSSPMDIHGVVATSARVRLVRVCLAVSGLVSMRNMDG